MVNEAFTLVNRAPLRLNLFLHRIKPGGTIPHLESECCGGGKSSAATRLRFSQLLPTATRTVKPQPPIFDLRQRRRRNGDIANTIRHGDSDHGQRSLLKLKVSAPSDCFAFLALFCFSKKLKWR